MHGACVFRPSQNQPERMALGANETCQNLLLKYSWSMICRKQGGWGKVDGAKTVIVGVGCVK